MDKVYILHHTNQGTPESNEIHGVYASEEALLQIMRILLEEEYNTTMEENEEEDCIYMWYQELPLQK